MDVDHVTNQVHDQRDSYDCQQDHQKVSQELKAPIVSSNNDNQHPEVIVNNRPAKNEDHKPMLLNFSMKINP